MLALETKHVMKYLQYNQQQQGAAVCESSISDSGSIYGLYMYGYVYIYVFFKKKNYKKERNAPVSCHFQQLQVQ
jgi:hypothetical protein